MHSSDRAATVHDQGTGTRVSTTGRQEHRHSAEWRRQLAPNVIVSTTAHTALMWQRIRMAGTSTALTARGKSQVHFAAHTTVRDLIALHWCLPEQMCGWHGRSMH